MAMVTCKSYNRASIAASSLLGNDGDGLLQDSARKILLGGNSLRLYLDQHLVLALVLDLLIAPLGGLSLVFVVSMGRAATVVEDGDHRRHSRETRTEIGGFSGLGAQKWGCDGGGSTSLPNLTAACIHRHHGRKGGGRATEREGSRASGEYVRTLVPH